MTISQLTIFGPWKRMDSIPHPLGRSLITRPTPPWAPPSLDGIAAEHSMLYPRRLWDYPSVWIFVSIRSITSKSPCSTAQMACANPKPRSSRMFSVPMAIPVGCGGRRRCSGSGAVCRQLVSWRVGQKKVSSILVGPGKKVLKRKEIPVLATVESAAVIFL